MAQTVKKVVAVLIKPSSYDDAGFAYRFRRIVPTCHSLVTLYDLTCKALTETLPGLSNEVYLIDDGLAAHARQVRVLQREFPQEGTTLIVGLVGVQTAQFPRACDIASAWQKLGATVVIGGPHVTGSISCLLDGLKRRGREVPCPHTMPPELAALQEQNVVLFHGEIEPADKDSTWAQALRDIVAGKPQRLYRGGHPALQDMPISPVPPEYASLSATSVKPFDSGRGCPFECSFCCEVTNYGQIMRCRKAEQVLAYVDDLLARENKACMFIADDNFGRSPYWQEITDGLISHRQNGHEINFMLQCDLVAAERPGFLEKIAAAGCNQIFFGVESVNADNLQAAGKRQNNPARYQTVFEQCHQLEIGVHAAYIIGFPHDTPSGVEKDVETLISFGASQVSFYMYGPIPGSEDYVNAVMSGAKLDPDWNNWDSFHPVPEHPLMTAAEWTQAYQRAWRQFYRPKVMIQVLKRFKNRAKRLRLLCNFVWYWWAIRAQKAHPMVAGWIRVRSWHDRRPSAPRISYWQYLLRQVWWHLRSFGYIIAAFYVFQQVVFETECMPAAEEKRQQLTGRLRGIGDWFMRTFGPFINRQWLNEFWIWYAKKKWKLLWQWWWHLIMMPIALTEVVLTFRFLAKLPWIARGMIHRTT